MYFGVFQCISVYFGVYTDSPFGYIKLAIDRTSKLESVAVSRPSPRSPLFSNFFFFFFFSAGQRFPPHRRTSGGV